MNINMSINIMSSWLFFVLKGDQELKGVCVSELCHERRGMLSTLSHSECVLHAMHSVNTDAHTLNNYAHVQLA